MIKIQSTYQIKATDFATPYAKFENEIALV